MGTTGKLQTIFQSCYNPNKTYLSSDHSFLSQIRKREDRQKAAITAIKHRVHNNFCK